jgi:hypothetical protein
MSASTIQSTLNTLNTESQFSTNRYQVFFLPGSYSGIAAEIGYYEAASGLGQNPQGVTISGYLTSNQTDSNGNLTTNFWRSLENMDINYSGTLQWGVSQGADLRRMYVNGALELTNTACGQASGGFIADSYITGSVNPCSQQQWYTRNSTIGSWSGGVWNMVFSGVQGAPTPNYPSNSYTVLPTTPVSREKPYLYVDSNGDYNVFVPSAQTGSAGATWLNGATPGYSLPIANFFIAQPTNSLNDINTALQNGMNLILTPGIYQYSGAINITNPNTIVLGLGYATLVPQAGNAAITVADVDGVQIAGLIVDAGPVNSLVLFQIGAQGAARISHQQNPITLNDICFRIGGAETGMASTSLEIDSNNVILDNIWAWRADHGLTAVGWAVNPANNGVVVNGDNVTALGLAVEHYEQNQVLWNGNGGQTIFYQSELPYDVPSQNVWTDGAANGYSSYAVSSGVTNHAAYGLGVYSYFDQGVSIIEDNAITVPNAPGVTVNDAASVFLAGSGQISATVDGVGTVAKSGAIKSNVVIYQGVACGSGCPDTPTNLTPWVISPTQINLTWNPSLMPGVVYNVYRSTVSGFTPSLANQLTSGTAGTLYADTVSPSTTYYYIVEAHGAAGYSSPTQQVSALTPANGGTIATDVVKIDSGYTGAAPPTGWVADVTGTNNITITGSSSAGSACSSLKSTNTTAAPNAVYTTARKGSGSGFTYAIANLTAGKSYIVDLYLADNYYSTAGSREFNVFINGSQVLKNFDIAGTTGNSCIAMTQSFYTVADITGSITVQFSNGAYNSPEVEGIEIGLGSIPAPGAPSNLTAQLAANDQQINLGWTASSTSGVQYEVFRSLTPSFAPSSANLLTTTTATFFADTAIAPGTTYYYLVEANNSMLTSLPSQGASAATPPLTLAVPIPAAPTTLTAAMASNSQINLLWVASTTPDVQYQVIRGTTPNVTLSNGTAVATTPFTSLSDTGLNSATMYYYAVVAENSGGNSSLSNIAAGTTSGTPTITWSPAASITFGTTLNGLLAATASVPGGFAYTATPSMGGSAVTVTNSTVLSAGSYALTANFTPADMVDYTAVTQTVLLTVNQVTPSITWATPAAINYGTPLDATQLNASSVVSGSFAYTPAAGSVLGAGTPTLSVTFTPTDTVDYIAVTQTVLLTVNQVTPSITWSTPAAINYGTPLVATQLNASSTVSGSFAYTPAAGSVLGAGTPTLSVTFTPTDTADYTSATQTVQLTVNKTSPAISWATPTAISYGTPLSTTQLNAAFGVAGSCIYTPAVGVVLGVGSQTLSVTCTPTDTTDYTAQSAIVTQVVNPEVSSVFLTPNPASTMLGGAVSFGVTVHAAYGTPTGTVTFLDGTTLLATTTLSGGTASFATTSLAVGAHTISAAYAGDGNDLKSTSTTTTESIIDVSISSTGIGSQTILPGGSASFTFALTPSSGSSLPLPATISVAGLPSGAIATLTGTGWTTVTSTSWLLPANTATGAATLTITAPAGTANLRNEPGRRPGVGSTVAPFALCLLLLPWAGRLRRTALRMRPYGMLVLLFAIGVLALAAFSGCGGPGFFSQKQQSYPVTVTVTAGSQTHSTNVNLIVE